MFLRYSVFFFMLFCLLSFGVHAHFFGVTLLPLTLNLNFQIFRMRLGLM